MLIYYSLEALISFTVSSNISENNENYKKKYFFIFNISHSLSKEEGKKDKTVERKNKNVSKNLINVKKNLEWDEI